MIGHGGLTIDNRDSAQMYDYLEARIDVLTRRVRELEAENRTLRHPRMAKIQSGLPQVPTAELAKRMAG
jgi:hypothetical protein